MKSLVSAVVAAVALSASFGAFAQSTVTRAQVRNELVQLESAGYKPSQSSPYYPADIQAASCARSAIRTCPTRCCPRPCAMRIRWACRAPSTGIATRRRNRSVPERAKR